MQVKEVQVCFSGCPREKAKVSFGSTCLHRVCFVLTLQELKNICCIHGGNEEDGG